jgi:myo-inositol-1(or 4)-monophosphatase
MAWRIAADGRVTVSDRKSTSSGIGTHGTGPLTSSAVPDPAELVALARRLAEEAGALVKTGRRHGLSHVTTKSTSTDMVTEYDRLSEELIAEGIMAARPHDAIVGEEGADRAGTSGIDWLIDPIDGTTNFLYGLPGYAISIGARDGDGLLAGVVHVPALGETFHAGRGSGAFLNDAPIRCTGASVLATSLVGTGFNYDPGMRVRQTGALVEIIGRIRDIRRFGAASVDLCHVACGRLDAYYERGLGPWDLAAGELIVREAGGVITGFDGGAAEPGAVVAAAPGIHAQLLALLAEAGA